MRKGKIKEAIKFSLHHYYEKGLTATAKKFERELLKRVYKRLKKNNP